MSQAVNVLINARDNASAAFNRAGDAAKRFGSGLLSLKGLLAGALGGFAIKATMEKAVSLWATQEQAEAKLAATIRATGGAAGFSAEQLKQYAAQLQKSTTFGDEAIINGQALLTTFKEIKGDNFQRATRAMLDLTAAMGGDDLKGAAIQLGKALNDPLKGITALSRVGVSFTDAQRQQIQQFMAAGEIAKAQGVILDELEGEFGGVAEAMANTATGGLRQFHNAVSDTWETIGKAFAPTLNALARQLTNMLPHIHSAAEWLGEHLQTAFAVAKWAATNWQQGMELACVTSQLAILSFYEDVKYFFTESIPTYLAWFGRNWKEVFIDALNAVGYAFENFGRNVWTIMKEVWTYITSWGEEGFQEGWTNNLRGLLDGFTSVIQEGFPTVAERGITATEQALSVRMDELTANLQKGLADALAATPSAYKTPELKTAAVTAATEMATAAKRSELKATEARFLGRSPADDAARRAADQTQRNTATMVKLLTRSIDLTERQLQIMEQTATTSQEQEEVDI